MLTGAWWLVACCLVAGGWCWSGQTPAKDWKSLIDRLWTLSKEELLVYSTVSPLTRHVQNSLTTLYNLTTILFHFNSFALILVRCWGLPDVTPCVKKKSTIPWLCVLLYALVVKVSFHYGCRVDCGWMVAMFMVTPRFFLGHLGSPKSMCSADPVGGWGLKEITLNCYHVAIASPDYGLCLRHCLKWHPVCLNSRLLTRCHFRRTLRDLRESIWGIMRWKSKKRTTDAKYLLFKSPGTQLEKRLVAKRTNSIAKWCYYPMTASLNYLGFWKPSRYRVNLDLCFSWVGIR